MTHSTHYRSVSGRVFPQSTPNSSETSRLVRLKGAERCLMMVYAFKVIQGHQLLHVHRKLLYDLLLMIVTKLYSQRFPDYYIAPRSPNSTIPPWFDPRSRRSLGIWSSILPRKKNRCIALLLSIYPSIYLLFYSSDLSDTETTKLKLRDKQATRWLSENKELKTKKRTKIKITLRRL